MRETKNQILKDANQEYIKASRIDNNTFQLEYKDGCKAIRFHHTDIIVFKPNGDVVLNSGGWHTPTTKNRINEYNNRGLTIYQRNNIWYIKKDGDNYNEKTNTVFYDGITFKNNGIIKGKNIKNDTINKKTNKIKKQINKYVNLLDKMDKLPLPNNGDCWHCLFKTVNDNIPLGDKVKDHSHLKQHIKENYIHGSLLVNALKEAGYNDTGISYHMRSDYKGGIKRALRKYLYKRLLKEA